MQSAGREPSMEDILASIKKVIAEEKELRGGIVASPQAAGEVPLPEEQPIEASEDDVLELVETLAPPADLGPPLVDEEVAGHSRQALEQLQTVAASIPANRISLKASRPALVANRGSSRISARPIASQNRRNWPSLPTARMNHPSLVGKTA